MKSTIITILLALIATTGWAQKNEKIWDNVVIGNTNVDWSEVTKVGLFADRTEVGLRIKYRQGSWISIAKSTFIEADGKQYPIKDATVIGLDNRYTLSTNSFDFTLIFEPVPQQIKTFDVIEPGGWEYRHLRNADDLPDGITDTYWRNEATGEWLIGFTANHVVYNNKVWNIVSQTKKKDAYSLMLAGGLSIKVDKLKKGKRNITIGNGKPVSCSPITKATLPDHYWMAEGYARTGLEA